MNRNRTIAATLTFLAVLAVALGSVFALGGGTDDALAPASATEQQLTVTAHDTQQAPIGGVAVRLVDSRNTDVATGTTNAAGEVVLSFDPKVGDYAVIATEPEGYRARDDKDGGAAHQGDPTCDNVYLCIYLTATAAQDGSIIVTIPDVTVDQQQALDDLWFEMTPPVAPTEDDPSVTLGDDLDETDVLVGDGDDDLLAGGDDLLIDPQPLPVPPGLSSICINVEHQPVPDQGSASGVWVRGEVYGLDGGWIWVQGPTFNDGEPVQLPVTDGAFEGPLGINSYGGHAFERFELGSDSDGVEPIDLLPALDSGPGSLVTVTGAEGPAFDSECFDLEQPATSTADLDDERLDELLDDFHGNALDEQLEDLHDQDLPGQLEDPTVSESGGERIGITRTLDDFLAHFIADHTAGDVDGLLDTLHPAIPLAFGEAECDAYVTRTTGSLTGAEVLSVGQPTDVDLESPAGTVTITDVIPFEVEFTLVDGSTMTNEANLALHDGEAHWLTRCGR